MKICIFYSWQSDLPNNKNRGLINTCIKKATNEVLKNSRNITEFEIDMDSRNESGTPDLVHSIIEKIEACDIFVADISIINSNCDCRLAPNPNVLFELGYAAKTLGWHRTLCLFNKEYARIEDLPFDIRFRKPIVYDTSKSVSDARSYLTNELTLSIQSIIDNELDDKKEYSETKRTIDLFMQSVLIDFCRLLYETHEKSPDRYNYPKLLNSSPEEIKGILLNRTILGFHALKNVSLHIKELIQFFNDNLETYFLSENEKRLVVKMVYALRHYQKLLRSKETFEIAGTCTEYVLSAGKEINPQNPENSFLLLKPLQDGKAVVISGGEFEQSEIPMLLNNLAINSELIDVFVSYMFEIVSLINDWIKLTGNYFIVNPKLFTN